MRYLILFVEQITIDSYADEIFILDLLFLDDDNYENKRRFLLKSFKYKVPQSHKQWVITYLLSNYYIRYYFIKFYDYEIKKM